jgi:uncharacterized protein YciI
MYYVLLYEVVEDFINKRAPYREEHLNRASEAQHRGELLMAGAFAEPADGAALIFRGTNPAIATDFAESDPYVLNGLVSRWRVRAWNVVVGG